MDQTLPQVHEEETCHPRHAAANVLTNIDLVANQYSKEISSIIVEAGIVPNRSN